MPAWLTNISISAVVQIFILYLAIYAILKRAKGSRFGQLLMGVGVLAALAALFTLVFQFDVLGEIIRLVVIYLALSSVVIFQPEIRRILSAVGALGYFERPTHDTGGAAEPWFIAKTVLALAERKMGALVAFERGISLRSYEASGVSLDARFSPELMLSVFTPPMPLHDGGMVVHGGRVSSAHCVFPVSNNPSLVTGGMRHRAAVGLSEETDAIVVVVSEESGTVSIAHNGHLLRFAGDNRKDALERWIGKAINWKRRKRLWKFSAISLKR